MCSNGLERQALQQQLGVAASETSLTGILQLVYCCVPFPAVADSGNIPSGNAPGATKFQSRSVRPKADIKLTAGKAINVPIETLIDQVVKSNKVRLAVLQACVDT